MMDQHIHYPLLEKKEQQRNFIKENMAGSLYRLTPQLKTCVWTYIPVLRYVFFSAVMGPGVFFPQFKIKLGVFSFSPTRPSGQSFWPEPDFCWKVDCLVNSQINTVANKRLKRQDKNTRVYVRININSMSISIYYTMSFVIMIVKYQLGTFRYFFLEFFLGVDQLMEGIYKN